MKRIIRNLLLGVGFLCSGAIVAQGLQGVIVENYHTTTQADADYYNGLGNGSGTMTAGLNTYRVFIDMAPGYRLNTVFGSAGNPLDITSTTVFWNDDGYGAQFPAQTSRLDDGAAFDTWITIGRASRSGGAAGCTSNLEQLGVPKASDPNGNLTMCDLWSGFGPADNDGHVPGASADPTLVGITAGNLAPFVDVDGGNAFSTTGSWALLPPLDGPEAQGANRVLIGQFTTAGSFSFHINISLQTPGGEVEFYTHSSSESGSVVSPFLTYPLANLDCNGDPGGSASIDQCGVCSGGNTGITPNSTCLDCNGDINGTASIDQCNVCSGGNTGITPNSTCSDCAGVPNGTASIDQCNICSGGTTGITPNSTCSDCAGVPNGTASIDQCNVCSGGTTGITPNSTCSDCAGVPNGTASIDLCNVCSGGTTGITPNSTCLDCNGDINGTAFLDNCNVCVGGNTGLTPCTNDCNGVPGGTASIDQCGVCSGGNTGITPNTTCLDCNGVINGTASIDQCNVCSGGTTGITPNSTCADCAGVPNGTASIDQCGVCSGGTTGITPNTTCLDCNGDINGTASIDNCGICSGGNTGITPNSTCTDCNGDVGGSASIDQCNVCSGGNTGIPPNSTCADCAGVPNGTASIDQCNVCSGGNTGIMPNSTCADCEGTPNGAALPGTPCDDFNANTEFDTWNMACQCIGTPIGGGCQFNEASLEIETDGVSTTLWEVRMQGTDALVASGGQLYPEGFFNESICLPDGCYYLVVTDDGGDGISGGGYVLRDPASRRIIDNAGNFTSGSISQIANGLGFCLPMGTDRLISSSCDKYDWTPTDYVVANDNPAVTAQYGVSNATSGYQLWWYNPNGGYSFRRYQSHSTSNGLAASATRACHFRVNGWSGNQLQENVLYNVRVRSRVAGVFNEFGPACRFILNPLRAQCPLTHLNSTAGNQYYSCGATREWGNGNYVSAQPTKRVLPGGGTQNANRYQFRFRLQDETFVVTRTSSTYHLQLNWITSPLMPGTTYLVDVRASFDNGATWCSDFIQPSLDPWGPVCTLTIAGPANNSLNMATEGAAQPARSAELSMYPNPNRGDQLFINLSQVEDGVNTVSVDIYDGFGKRVATRTIAVQDGFVNTVLELNGELATGMYLVNITAGSTLHTERLVIQP